MDNIKQISVVNQGLNIEYVDENNKFSYFNINREQTEEILGMNIDFGDYQPSSFLDTIEDEAIEDIKELVLQGYPVREYKDEEGNFYHKCGEIFINLDEDLSRGYIKDFLFKSKIFGVSCVVFQGDIDSDYAEEILVFAKDNKIFNHIFYNNQKKIDMIDEAIWHNADSVIIDADSVSTSVLSNIILYFYEEDISFGIINFEGDFDFINQYNGIIYEADDVTQLFSGYGMILGLDQIEFYNPHMKKKQEYSGDLNIAKKWIDFMSKMML